MNRLPIYVNHLYCRKNRSWNFAWSFLFLCWLHYPRCFLRVRRHVVILCQILLLKLNRFAIIFIYFLIKSHFLDFNVNFVFVFRWYWGWILHKKIRGYVSFQYNLKYWKIPMYFEDFFAFSFVKRYELTNQCLDSKQHEDTQIVISNKCARSS